MGGGPLGSTTAMDLTLWCNIFTARKQSLRRLCFYACLSVILFTRGSASVSRQPHPQTDCPWEQAPLPPPPSPVEGAGTPPGADTPWNQAPPMQCMLEDTANKPVVRILLECILVFVKGGKATSGGSSIFPKGGANFQSGCANLFFRLKTA